MNIYKRMGPMSEARRSRLAWIGLVLVCLMLASAAAWAQMGSSLSGGNMSGSSASLSGGTVAGSMGGAAGGLAGAPNDIGGLLNNLTKGKNLDPAMLSAIAQQLGISPEEALRLSKQLSQTGKLTKDQLDQLSVRLAATHFSDSEITSLARLVGMSQEQVLELKNRINRAKPLQRRDLPETDQSQVSEFARH